MKNSQKCYDNLTLMVVLAVAYGIFGQPAAAGIVTKGGTGTDLTAGASWGGTAPGSSDVATWTGSSLGTGLTLGSSSTWGGISVSGALTDIGITGGGLLTLGAGGIDMSASTVNMSLGIPINIAANQTWIVNGLKTLTVSGNVGVPTYGLTKSGAGALMLSGANSFQNITINTGTTKVFADSNLGVFSSSLVANQLTFSGGTLEIMTGFPLYTNRGITVTAAGGTLTVDTGQTLNINATYNASLPYSVISGSGALMLNGPGTVQINTQSPSSIFYAANPSFNGPLTINGGTLLLNDGGTVSQWPSWFATLPSLTLGGGNLHITGSTSFNTTYWGTMGNLILNPGANSITLDYVGLYNGYSSSLTLSNTWTRSTGATLLVDLTGGDTTKETPCLATTGPLATQNGILGYALVRDSGGTGFATTNYLNNVNNFTGWTLQRYRAAATLTAGSNDGTRNYSTAGNVTLSPANSIRANSLAIISASTVDLGGSSDLLTLTSGGLLNTGSGVGMIQNGQITSGGPDLIIHDYGNLTISAPIVNNGVNPVALTLSGTGGLTLSGANSYTGGTRINAGQLLLSSGNNRLANSGAITAAGGVLDLGGNSQMASGTISFQGGIVQNGTMINNTTNYDGQSGTISATLAGSVGLTKTGNGVLTLTGTNTYSGATVVNGGNLKITRTHGVYAGSDNATYANWRTASTLKTLSINGSNIYGNDGYLMFACDVTSTSANSGGIFGDNPVTWSGTTFNDNTIKNVVSLPPYLTVANNALNTSAWDYGYQPINNPTGGNMQSGLGFYYVVHDATERDMVDLTITASVSGLRLGLFDGGDPMGRYRVAVNGDPIGISAVYNGSGFYFFDLTGLKSGDVIHVYGTGTGSDLGAFLGGLTFDSFTTNIVAANVLPTGSTVQIAGSATLELNGISEQTGSLADSGGTGGNVINSGGSPITLTIGNDGTSTSFSGVITNGTGALNLIKVGSGIQTLAGSCTYNGTTTVSNGTLLVNGSIGTNTVTVTANATLGGTGTINGVVTLNNGGTIQPTLAGTSSGTLTLSSAASPTFNANCTLKIRAGSSAMDQIILSSSTQVFSCANLDLVIDTTLLTANVNGLKIVQVANPAGGISGIFHSVKVIGNTSYAATIHYNTQTITVDLASSGPTVDHFAISALGSPQTAGTPITGITITAQDAGNNTVTTFGGWVNFGGTAGVTGTSGIFTAGVLTGVSVTPTVAGSGLTVTVMDPVGHTGIATISTINPGGVSQFFISPARLLQTAVGTLLTLTSITAKDMYGNTCSTGPNTFNGTVTFGGTAGVTGTSAAFSAGVLMSPGVMPTQSGIRLTVTVTDGANHTGLSTFGIVSPGPAQTVALTSGNSQSGIIGTTLGSPFIVMVTDGYGNPVTGSGVTFSVATTPNGATGQSLSTVSTTTDTNGQAATILTLGNLTGTYTVTATSSGLTGSPVTFAASATTQAVLSVTLSTNTVPRFHLLQMTVAIGATYNNPFNPGEVDLHAVFTAPSGTNITVNGFWDGTAWRIRFAAAETGQYQYVVSLVDLSGTRQATGSFGVVGSSDHGWIRTSLRDPHYLEQADGTPFYGVGFCLPWSVDTNQFTTMSTNGCNIFVYWLPSWDNAVVDLFDGYDRYNMTKAGNVDQIFAAAEAQGIKIILTVWNHDFLQDESGDWYNNPFDALSTCPNFSTDPNSWQYQQQLYRYFIARWGYSQSLAAWHTISEIDGTEQTYSWHTEINNYFVQNDPYGHPTTGSRGDTQIWPGLNVMDWPQVHNYGGAQDAVGIAGNVASITSALFAGYDKPNFHGEFGLQTSAGEPARTAYQHNGMWAALMTGAAITPLMWEDGSAWGTQTPSMYASSKSFQGFVSGINMPAQLFKQATIATSLAGGNAWGLGGSNVVMGWVQDTAPGKVVSGATVTFTGLTNGNYTVQSYDTWNGFFSAPVVQTVSSGSLTIQLPDFTNDAAVRLVSIVPGPGQTNTVINLNDSGPGSLRDTIGKSALGNVINFASGLSGNITLTNGELAIAQALTILGPGVKTLTVSGNNSSRVFNISSGTVVISGLTIANGYHDNTVQGGGIANAGNLTVSNCDFVGNHADEDGGAIYNSVGTLTVVNCTFNGNSASFGNAGDVGGAIDNQGTAIILNSTFFNNVSIFGGAIGNETLGTLLITNCTLSGNNGAGNAQGGGIYDNGGHVTIRNTILAGNSAGVGPEYYGLGTLTSGGFNLIGKTNDSTGWVATDLKGSSAVPLNPLLSPLQDNGGPTYTMTPLPGSPAIDAGNSSGLTTDQRGWQRPYDFLGIPNAAGGDGSDIGAVEISPPALSIALSSGNAVLSWSTNYPGYAIETTTALNPPAVWSVVPGTPAIIGSQFVLSAGSATYTRFFRLAPYIAGSALSFDGVAAYVNIGAAPLLPPWTAEFWVNRQDASNYSASLLGDGNTALKLEQFNFSRQVGFTQFGVADYTFNYSAPTNTWVHLAFVCDTTTRLYVNGVLQDSNPNVINLPLGSLGYDSSGHPDYLKGTIDEIRAWNVARTQAQIQADMNHTLTVPQTNLAGYWRFDEASGPGAVDSSGQGKAGTLQNNPIWIISSAPLVP